MRSGARRRDLQIANIDLLRHQPARQITFRPGDARTAAIVGPRFARRLERGGSDSCSRNDFGPRRRAIQWKLRGFGYYRTGLRCHSRRLCFELRGEVVPLKSGVQETGIGLRRGLPQHFQARRSGVRGKSLLRREAVPSRAAGVIFDRANRRRTRRYVEDSRPRKAPLMRGAGPPQPQ